MKAVGSTELTEGVDRESIGKLINYNQKVGLTLWNMADQS
jgi:hypothetical protein